MLTLHAIGRGRVDAAVSSGQFQFSSGIRCSQCLFYIPSPLFIAPELFRWKTKHTTLIHVQIQKRLSNNGKGIGFNQLRYIKYVMAESDEGHIIQVVISLLNSNIVGATRPDNTYNARHGNQCKVTLHHILYNSRSFFEQKRVKR